MEKIPSEKPDIEIVEHIEPIQEAVDPDFEKKIIRRIDWRLLPLMSALYSVSLMDRSNLSVARTAGMGEDLNLTVSNRYSTVSCLYFVPYILFQLPSNVLLRFFGVRVWLTICVSGWGAVQLGMGFVRTWGQLALCRVLLGLFEAGFFPALVFVITTWYKRHEVQKRLAVFYLSSIVIGGFSGIIGYAITFLKGKSGLNSWNWIFIVEGILTLVLAIFNQLFISDFPQKNTFLTAKQTRFILARVENDRGDSVPDEITVSKVLHHLSDWTIWACALMFMSSTMPAYAIAYFVTIILNSMGWGVKASLLLTTPPYVFAAISCFIFAWMSDKTKRRAPFIAVQALMTITGIAVTGYAEKNGPRYFGLFLANAGASGCIPSVLAYSSNNIVSHSKRAVSTAIVISAGGVGGIFATTVFREQDFPRYLNGIWATIGCQILILVLLALTSWNFARKNRLLKEGKIAGPLEGQPGFFYTL
ncbi:major facilitator superfamily domain-containing protein [Mycena albidolilacea]|uniref:Major facilitator superfamily domain-containing protein n=1 Tax=Mycena albidolilacea TaxID=1033008 RepID=A0AAD7A038_9AGAR|nr:major facilitator superfamily domain-containing protein [Mycena albidolilacea]